MPASRRSLSVSFLLRSSVLAVSTLLQLLTTTAGHDSGGRCEAFHAVHVVSTSVSSSLFCMKYLALRSGMSDRRLLSSDLDSFVPHAASVSSSPARQRPLVTDSPQPQSQARSETHTSTHQSLMRNSYA